MASVFKMESRNNSNNILDMYFENTDTLLTEAVFTGGKKKLENLEKIFEGLKEELDKQIKIHEDNAKQSKPDSSKWFDKIGFWRDPRWKEVEDELSKIFGFRSVKIAPYQESYSSKTKIFESMELNCSTWTLNRYPIDGLVTDNGFYDKTRSIYLDSVISVGLIKNLSAAEIVAVFLHEIGHNIDPAIMSISYTETNVLSKYMSEREKDISEKEKSLVSKLIKFKDNIAPSNIFVKCLSNRIKTANSAPNGSEERNLFGLFSNKGMSDKNIDKHLGKIVNAINEDTDQFDRIHAMEAFADNFARMYGYGPQLMNALKKISKYNEKTFLSRIKKEKMRQTYIFYIAMDCIKDSHKTDIHRIRNLINEYNKDINDPNTHPKVKEQLKEDLNELEKCLNAYMNEFSDVQNRVNKTINDELTKIENKNAKK